MKLHHVFLASVAVALFACGHNGGSGTDGGGSGDGDGGLDDGGGGCVGLCTDAPPFGGMCTPGGPQCSNCIDDDGDGKIDGQDVECTGSLDNDESSFSTGIPGDNIDAVHQDCFFDGNSGSGNDGCNIHVCCLLGATTKAACPIGQNQYNPANCPPPIGTAVLSQKCIDTCGKLAPPGCDCFGCCTECIPGTNPPQCFDIDINPSTSPGCNDTNISDGAICKRCVKNTTCGNGTCGGTTCILCPGQDPSTLPSNCTGQTCPTGTTLCGAGDTCAMGTFCSNGCCIGVIQ
ncbi:hypothetical protein BH11MYX3_BH11MYX3_40690 [soil metagenome]